MSDEWPAVSFSKSNYDASNVHITHLACNLAKNDLPMEQFQEWIEVVRASGDVAS